MPLMIFLVRTRKGHHQSGNHWNLLEGNNGKFLRDIVELIWVYLRAQIPSWTNWSLPSTIFYSKLNPEASYYPLKKCSWSQFVHIALTFFFFFKPLFLTLIVLCRCGRVSLLLALEKVSFFLFFLKDCYETLLLSANTLTFQNNERKKHSRAENNCPTLHLAKNQKQW